MIFASLADFEDSPLPCWSLDEGRKTVKKEAKLLGNAILSDMLLVSSSYYVNRAGIESSAECGIRPSVPKILVC